MVDLIYQNRKIINVLHIIKHKVMITKFWLERLFLKYKLQALRELFLAIGERESRPSANK